jgi:hypothetical protein
MAQEKLDQFRTSSNIPLKAYYTPEDVPVDDETPGEYSFALRGNQRAGKRL